MEAESKVAQDTVDCFKIRALQKPNNCQNIRLLSCNGPKKEKEVNMEQKSATICFIVSN